MKTVYERKINFYETDKMKIVHHSNYIRFMEEARIDYMEKVGYSYVKLEEMGLGSPVISISCDYKKPSAFGDTLLIEVALKEYSGATFEFAYRMTNKADGTQIATGTSVHCFVSAEEGPVIVRRKYPELNNAFVALLEYKDERDGEDKKEEPPK